MAITQRRSHLTSDPTTGSPVLDRDDVGFIVDLCDTGQVAPTIDSLHDRWSAESRTRLGLSRQQWHHPATADLIDALAQGHDLTEPLRAVGDARAGAGLSLDETLADLEILAALIPALVVVDPSAGDVIGRVDTLRAASVVGTAWAESFYGAIVAPGCIDPITGLVTDSYLEARLSQLYRRAAATGRRADQEWVLVVAEIRGGDLSPFACIAQRIHAAGEVRTAFPNGDTIAVLDPTGAMVVLAANDGALANDVAALQATAPGCAIWVEQLPAAMDEALSLTRELATIPRGSTIAYRGTVRHP